MQWSHIRFFYICDDIYSLCYLYGNLTLPLFLWSDCTKAGKWAVILVIDLFLRLCYWILVLFLILMFKFNFVYTFWHVLYCLNKLNDDKT